MDTVSVEQATELILERIKAIDETEEIEVEDALGRILAEDMRSEFDNPPFDRSPIDGYACRSVDIAGASEERPVRLKVVEEVYAGAYTDREVRKGEAVRIMTGAPVPVGCDCCVRQEDTDYGEEVVRIFRPEKEWGNYCFRGEDFKAGSVLMKKGSRIGFVEMGVLAGMGRGTVPVYRLPRVVILTTGDEVVTPGDPLLPGKIYDSNRMLLTGRLKELGVRPSLVRWVEDRPEAMADTLREAAQKADLILTTGAVSVGKKDIMHEALKMAGAERVFWKVKVKPGMPTLFSVYQGVPVLSLSGNPFGVAAMTDCGASGETGYPEDEEGRLCPSGAGERDHGGYLSQAQQRAQADPGILGERNVSSSERTSFQWSVGIHDRLQLSDRHAAGRSGTERRSPRGGYPSVTRKT